MELGAGARAPRGPRATGPAARGRPERRPKGRNEVRKSIGRAAIIALACALPALAPGVTGGKRALAAPAGPAAQLAVQAKPWESSRLDEKGYPLDRRLLNRASVSEASITVADLLKAAQEQTGVVLHTPDHELAGQKVTVFATRAALNALMAQSAKLLGFTWWESADSPPEYTASYETASASARAQAEARARRASRIADWIAASTMTDEQLRAMLDTDPLLAHELLSSWTGFPARMVAQSLKQMSPTSMQQLLETGTVTVGVDELPGWYGATLRASYSYLAEWMASLGIPSADECVAKFRVRFFDGGELQYPEMNELGPNHRPGLVGHQVGVRARGARRVEGAPRVSHAAGVRGARPLRHVQRGGRASTVRHPIRQDRHPRRAALLWRSTEGGDCAGQGLPSSASLSSTRPCAGRGASPPRQPVEGRPPTLEEAGVLAKTHAQGHRASSRPCPTKPATRS